MQRSAELSVDDVDEITWDSSAFHSLVIPEKRKEIIQSLVERHTNGSNSIPFRDIIREKGQSLVILLQYDSMASAPHFLTFNF